MPLLYAEICTFLKVQIILTARFSSSVHSKGSVGPQLTGRCWADASMFRFILREGRGIGSP